MQTKSKHFLSGAIFFFGIFVGLALALAIIWGKYEATSYFFEGTTYASFNGLHCPVLMARSETGIIRAVFNNSDNQDDEPYYQMEIGGITPRNFENQLSLPPHTSKSVQWTADANDINLGFFIFAKLDILPDGIHPTREATCGILVLNISGLTGGQIFWFMLVISLMEIPAGFLLWRTTDKTSTGRALETQRAMLALAVLVLLSIFTGLMGWWFMGIILCAITFLLIAIMLGYSLSSDDPGI
jgi:hypothetical protein